MIRRQTILLIALFIILLNYIQPRGMNEYSIVDHIYIGANIQLGHQFNQGVFVSGHLTFGFIDFIGFMFNNSEYLNNINIAIPGLFNPGFTVGGKRVWGGYRSHYYEFQNSLVFGGFGVGKEFIYGGSHDMIYTKTRHKIWFSNLFGVQLDFQKDNSDAIKNYKNVPNFYSISFLGSFPFPLRLIW